MTTATASSSSLSTRYQSSGSTSTIIPDPRARGIFVLPREESRASARTSSPSNGRGIFVLPREQPRSTASRPSDTPTNRPIRTAPTSSLRIPLHNKQALGRLGLIELKICMQRFIEEIDWTWFLEHSGRLGEHPDDRTPTEIQRFKTWKYETWDDMAGFYCDWQEAHLRGQDIIEFMGQNYDTSNLTGKQLGRLVVGQMLMFFMGWHGKLPRGEEDWYHGWGWHGSPFTDERQVGILNTMLAGGDFLPHVRSWCRQNNTTYHDGRSAGT